MTDRVSLSTFVVLAIGVLSVSFTAILIRLADAPSMVVAAYRLGIAWLLLAPVALGRAAHELGDLNRTDIGLAALAGALLSLNFFVWITSLRYTSVASSVVLVTTSPLFVGLASPAILSEMVSRRMWGGILVAIAGGVIIGFGDISLGLREVFGDLLALAGAVMGAGYLVVGRRLRSRLSLLAYVFLAYGAAAVVSLALCLISGLSFAGYSQHTYLMFLLLAVIPQIVGHSSFNWALRHASAAFVSVTTMGEPVGATILAYLILREAPTLAQLVGGALILAGVYVVSQEQ